MKEENIIQFIHITSDSLSIDGDQMKYHQALNDIEKELSTLNLSRGGDNANFGFVFENMHASNKNIENFKSGTGEVLYVLDDNGVADFKNVSSSGKISYEQAKAGYRSNKNKVIAEKYSNMNKLVVDRGNDEVVNYARKHGVNVEESMVSQKDARMMREIMSVEGKIRTQFGGSNTAPLVAKLYKVGKNFNIAHEVGLKSAKGMLALSAGISIGKNLYPFINGDMEFKDFAMNVGKDTAISSLGTYATGATTSILGSALTNTGGGIILSNVSSVVVTTKAGQILMNIGSITASFSAALGPAILVGMSIGIGCSIFEICKETISKVQHEKAQVNRFLNNVIDTMEAVQRDLKILIDETYSRWDIQTEMSFKKMRKAIYDNNFEEISSSIDMILNIFDKEVRFHNMEEFDNFFYSNEALTF